MKVILVSDFSEIKNEHKLLNELFENGLEIFHLRKRDYSVNQMMDYIDAIPQKFHNRIVIHSHFHLLSVFDLKGCHFNKQYGLANLKQDAPKDLYDLILSKQLSFSVHNLQDIKNLDHHYSFVFISPVFNSISNRGYNSKIKIKSFQKFLMESDRNIEVIALGGIKDENIPLAASAGFDGVAMLGHIWNYYSLNNDVKSAMARYKEIKRLMESNMLNVSSVNNGSRL